MRILIQKYSSFSYKFKRNQELILPERMFLFRSIFSSSTICENYSVSHSLSSMSSSARFWFTIWAKDIAVSWGSFSIVHFPLEELLFFWLRFWFCFFPPSKKGEPPSSKSEELAQHVSLHFWNFQNFTNLFTSPLVQKKILLHLIIPK